MLAAAFEPTRDRIVIKVMRRQGFNRVDEVDGGSCGFGDWEREGASREHGEKERGGAWGYHSYFCVGRGCGCVFRSRGNTLAVMC
jgi:hypothetical protein